MPPLVDGISGGEDWIVQMSSLPN